VREPLQVVSRFEEEIVSGDYSGVGLGSEFIPRELEFAMKFQFRDCRCETGSGALFGSAFEHLDIK
jgi:hypothetical protein